MYCNENSVNGLFDVIGNLSKGVTNLSTQIIQGKQAYDATKAAWKGVPYPAPASAGVIPYALPNATGERFVPGTTQIAQAERPLTRDEIAALQSRLNSMGFNTGAVDGLFGPNTSAGVRAFQSAYGLPATGQLSVGLLQAVMSAGGSAGGAAGASPYIIAPFYPDPALNAGAAQKTAEEKLWTWVIPGVAALGGLLILMNSGKGRR